RVWHVVLYKPLARPGLARDERQNLLQRGELEGRDLHLRTGEHGLAGGVAGREPAPAIVSQDQVEVGQEFVENIAPQVQVVRVFLVQLPTAAQQEALGQTCRKSLLPV